MKSKTYKNKEEAYVEFIYAKKENDTKMRSAFRRATNPLGSYAVWEYVIPFMGEHFQIDKYRTAYILIGAYICMDKSTENGCDGLGSALVKTWGDKAKFSISGNDSIAIRIRKLLSCKRTEDLIKNIQPLLRVISERKRANLNYSRLLWEMIYFERDCEKIKIRWTLEYYKHLDRQND